MARSLRPQLNQIRTWVREGRTDAWIAHQLEISVRDLKQFKREHDLAPADEADADDRDLRAEDDALVAAALDAEADETEDTDDAEPDGNGADDGDRKPRRRGRRGGRGRARGGAGRRGKDLEGTFDHGEEGYGLWLDPAIQDDPVYAEHWAGHRPVVVSVEADRIVIKRSGSNGDDPAAGDDENGES